MEIKIVKIEKPDDVNIIIGQTHFIKSVEDIYEAIVNANPNIKFGIGFCESSGKCLVRIEGNDDEMKEIACLDARDIGAGHIFVVAIRSGYPINILNALKNVPEVCSIYVATQNPLEVIVAETETGRGILGVIDGSKPKGVETKSDVKWRKGLLRKLGYKL
ncbi:MAG: adenosine-specific kinase [Candidatus Omnitrophota bacterium]|nr:adenosine-specific kinase [Candidatus Omnitrophota bacterium]